MLAEDCAVALAGRFAAGSFREGDFSDADLFTAGVLPPPPPLQGTAPNLVHPVPVVHPVPGPPQLTSRHLLESPALFAAHPATHSALQEGGGHVLVREALYAGEGFDAAGEDGYVAAAPVPPPVPESGAAPLASTPGYLSSALPCPAGYFLAARSVGGVPVVCPPLQGVVYPPLQGGWASLCPPVTRAAMLEQLLQQQRQQQQAQQQQAQQQQAQQQQAQQQLAAQLLGAVSSASLPPASHFGAGGYAEGAGHPSPPASSFALDNLATPSFHQSALDNLATPPLQQSVLLPPGVLPEVPVRGVEPLFSPLTASFGVPPTPPVTSAAAEISLGGGVAGGSGFVSSTGGAPIYLPPLASSMVTMVPAQGYPSPPHPGGLMSVLPPPLPPAESPLILPSPLGVATAFGMPPRLGVPSPLPGACGYAPSLPMLVSGTGSVLGDSAILQDKGYGVAAAARIGRTHLPLNQSYPRLMRVHESPPVYVCEGFLSDEECEALIRHCVGSSTADHLPRLISSAERSLYHFETARDTHVGHSPRGRRF